MITVHQNRSICPSSLTLNDMDNYLQGTSKKILFAVLTLAVFVLISKVFQDVAFKSFY